MIKELVHSIGLQYTYNAGTKIVFPKINVLAGQTLLILGNSGVGKTTLLHLLAGIKPIQQGNIYINNQNLGDLKAEKLINFRSKNISVVYQKPHFIQSLNCLENLKIALQLSNNAFDKCFFDEVIATLNIENILAKNTFEISLGEAQRLSIARAILTKPSLILADEPTSSLDDESCKKVTELLQKMAKSLNAALIIVTHDQRLKNVFSNQITLI